MSICLCGGDEKLSLRWLIYDRASDGEIAWCRVPGGMNPWDLVHEEDGAGDHTSPVEVRLWLERREVNPWGEVRGGGDAVVLNTLRDKILARKQPREEAESDRPRLR